MNLPRIFTLLHHAFNALLTHLTSTHQQEQVLQEDQLCRGAHGSLLHLAESDYRLSEPPHVCRVAVGTFCGDCFRLVSPFVCCQCVSCG